MTKTTKLVLGIAVMATAYYLWKKNRKKEKTSNCDGYSNVQGQKMKDCCVRVDGNGKCVEYKSVPTMRPCPNPKKLTAANMI